MNHIEVDLAIIGGGPAGLAAAIEAKRSGANRVVILERDKRLGGLLHQCIHNGFGLHCFQRDLTGPEYAWRFLDQLKKLDIEIYLETMVIQISPGKEIIAINSQDGVLSIKAKGIVLAMGCRERSRGQIKLPGSRPSGIFTAGTAQRFINIEGTFPGRRVVILGSGDIGMIMARRLTLEGAKVEAMAELLPYIGGLVRNEVQCLRDFNIPVYLRHTITNIYGEKKVEAVDIAQVDDSLNPIPDTKRRIECDTLFLSVGLIPENEVSKTAGIEISDVGGPEVDENMQTNIPGIFAAGNVVHVHDLVDYVTLVGERAGSSAARYILGNLEGSQRRIVVEAGNDIRYVIPQYISEGKDVSLYIRVKRPAEEAVIQIAGGLIEKKEKKVKPSEMIKINLSKEVISKLRGETLRIDCLIEEGMKSSKEEVEKGEEIICLTCPFACRGRVAHKKEEIKEIFGYRCKRGEEYVKKEIMSPERVLTTTVRTTDPEHPLLPVRTHRPIPKKLLKDCMNRLRVADVKEPVEIGDVIIPNILNTGVDIIATSKFPEPFRI